MRRIQSRRRVYELLTGRARFKGDTQFALLEQVASAAAARVPPAVDEQRAARELDRICLKALSKAGVRPVLDGARLRGRTCGTGWRTRIIEGGRFRMLPRPVAIPRIPRRSHGTSARRWDVFFSYAGPDKPTALRMCETARSRGFAGVDCSRDHPAGDELCRSDPARIETSATCVVLLSTASNGSPHVANEVERAVSERKRLIPVRLEDVSARSDA